MNLVEVKGPHGRRETIPNFPSYKEALQWMEAQVDDPYIDNHRFAYHDDEPAMKQYRKIKSTGCCGSFNAKIMVRRRIASIGCNYGH